MLVVVLVDVVVWCFELPRDADVSEVDAFAGFGVVGGRPPSSASARFVTLRRAFVRAACARAVAAGETPGAAVALRGDAAASVSGFGAGGDV